jgi:hypothetical protein
LESRLIWFRASWFRASWFRATPFRLIRLRNAGLGLLSRPWFECRPAGLRLAVRFRTRERRFSSWIRLRRIGLRRWWLESRLIWFQASWFRATPFRLIRLRNAGLGLSRPWFECRSAGLLRAVRFRTGERRFASCIRLRRIGLRLQRLARSCLRARPADIRHRSQLFARGRSCGRGSVLGGQRLCLR